MLGVVGVISGLFGGLVTYFVGKKLINTGFSDKFDEILDYLSTPEGQQSVRNLGTLFSQGITKGIGAGASPLKGKTFGIPNSILLRIVDQFMPQKGDKAKSKETPLSSSESFG